MASSNELAEELMQQYDSLLSERKKLETEWEEISNYMLPRPLKFSTSTDFSAEDMRPPNDIVASIARSAVSVFSAGMLSGVSSPSSQWFRVVAQRIDQNDLVNEEPVVSGWCEYMTSVFARMLQDQNYYGQQVSGYEFLGTIGHSCLFVGYDEMRKIPVFRDISPDTMCFAEGNSGLVNVVFRDIFMSGAQLLQRFGEQNLSSDMTGEVKTSAGKAKKFRVVHAVIEKDAGYENIMGSNKLPFAGYFYDPESGHMLEEGGYNTMPYIVTRAQHSTRTVYSSSFGLCCLADCRMLNEMRKLELQAAQVSVAPPLIAPNNKLLKRFSFEPWALNAYDKQEGLESKDFMAIPMNADPRMLEIAIRNAEQQINATFNVDMFLMLQMRTRDRGTPTAQEVVGLQQEKAFILGPMLNNLQQENFGQLFKRCYDIAEQMGVVPEAPPQLVERGLTLEYLSPLLIAQQQQKASTSISALAEIASVVGAVNPEALDNFNYDALTRDSALLKGVPATQLRPASEVAQLREQRAQMQQQMQQQQAAERQQIMAADAYSKTTKAPEFGSAAEKLINAAGQA